MSDATNADSVASAAPSGGSEHGGRLVLLAAVILGIAAVLTAWASYRASLTSDNVIKNYAEQQALISDANDTYAISDRESQIEQQFFLQYAIARAEGNSDVASYLIDTMGDELYQVVLWWEEQPQETQPLSPFVVDNPNFAQLPSQDLILQGDDLKSQADAKRVLAETADVDSDRFELANVFFAIVLFLAGIATLHRYQGDLTARKQ